MAEPRKVIVVEAIGFVGRPNVQFREVQVPPYLATARPENEQDQPGRLAIDWPGVPGCSIYADAWLEADEVADASQMIQSIRAGENRG